MTSTPEFLSRRDRDALRAQYRKEEKAVRIVQADFEGHVGLLAVTDRRVLFVSRRVLRTFVREVSRDEIERVTQRTERYGSLVLKTRAGRRLEFWMQARGAAHAIAEALKPAGGLHSKAAPVEFKTTSPAPRPGQATPGQTAHAGPTPPAPRPTAVFSTADGLSYQATNTAERRARLDRQLAIGAITKAEYQWQLDSIR